MRETLKNLMIGSIAAVILAGAPTPVRSQYRQPAMPVLAPRPPRPTVLVQADTSEKSIKVDDSVILELCVTDAKVRVNGWSRSEVRVYIEDGNRFSLNVRDKSAKTGAPNWIRISGIPNRSRFGASSDCLTGTAIDIDAPAGAEIRIKGTEATTQIDSIKKATVSTIGGAITIRRVSGGIDASGHQGDLMVQSSTGPMKLETTTGNIVVFEAEPGEIGDPFSVKTNRGTVSLQSVRHRQVDVGSISGSVLYAGTIRNGGAYRFNTSSGSIRMGLPADTACQVAATFGAGNFNSEIPLKPQTENISEGPIKSIVGRLGTGGDATLKLTTNNGSISIRKQ